MRTQADIYTLAQARTDRQSGNATLAAYRAVFYFDPEDQARACAPRNRASGAGCGRCAGHKMALAARGGAGGSV